MSNQFEIVPFHQHQILTVKRGDGVAVVMKPIVEVLGLDWHGQRQRIHRHEVLSKGACVIRVPSAGGMQEALALDLEQFHGWLITLTPERIKDAAKRELIVRYQTEAFRVVFEHFHGKMNGSPKPVRAAGLQISLHNHYLMLAKKLRLSSDPVEREMIYGLFVDVAEQIGHVPPPLASLGQVEPQAHEIIERFWEVYRALEERGHSLNMARRPDLISIHLKTMQAAIEAERLDFDIDTSLHGALRQSKSLRFTKHSPVNCIDGACRSCWTFKRLDTAQEQ